MISVLINSEKSFGLDLEKIRETAKEFLKDRPAYPPAGRQGRTGRQTKKVEVSIALVERQTIQRLNQQYRGEDKATTVLSFPQEEKLKGQARLRPPRRVTAGQAKDQIAFPPASSGVKRLGDVVICPPVATEQNLTIDFLLKHGLTNLLSEISAPESFRTRPR